MKYDKFYTPPNIVEKCIEIFEREVRPIGTFSRIIEPSAGDGAFLKYLPKHTLAYDIKPEHPSIKELDYTKNEIPTQNNSLVIGNPPFDIYGNGSHMGSRLFLKYSQHSEYVGYILAMANYNHDINPYFKLIHSEMLPLAKYSGLKMRCVFNIYKKRTEPYKPLKVKVDIKLYNKGKRTPPHKTEEYLKAPYDFRVCMLGNTRIPPNDYNLLCKECKVTLPTEYKYLLSEVKEKLSEHLKYIYKNRTTLVSITKSRLIKFIWDNWEELRK